ncbi:P-loop containing nucleoside triphosphate hydrolase [Pseudocohnilembus persalinus]|uniref:DNA replication licensing factor MCM7 n=1 Tax=Pseudocohnilembus persalinus TaxID=266149 RepID=A0A0V0Q838_PSEPJ|nr:P-loop containing nucleoside triphosphate hydrolase [Pseudocohnilembus persalinus]|eukprot:KRW98341.1 P-loop containing nucleoside triphosphate hydrolase [Pseudocohnilembus persalinus]
MEKQQFKQESKYYIPSYKEEKGLISDFLLNYVWPNPQDLPQEIKEELQESGLSKYCFQVKKQLESRKRQKRVDILIEDLENHFTNPADQKLLQGIKSNTLIYKELFEETIQSSIVDNNNWAPPERGDDEQEESDEDDDMQQDLLMNQRVQRLDQANPQNPQNQIHPKMKKRIEVYFINGPQTKGSKPVSLRSLKSHTIGSLVTTEAIVVRISEVKPQIVVAAYVCQTCGFEIFQGVSGVVFTPLNECPSQRCTTNKTKGKLQLINSNSLFQSYQEITVQETSNQVPQGSIPRSFLVIARGDNVRKCTAGDLIKIQGVYSPILENTFRGSQRLMMNTYIEAFSIEQQKKKYSQVELTEEVATQITTEFQNLDFSQFYDNMSASLAPQLYGLEDVKKAILLMLVGGERLDREDGLHIRGDVNIALIGDPGIAKSQLLKKISAMAPRSVYTTGKGSSGVGLTASVVKDPQSGEISLEAGALVLADKGVCCIDEFDKMDDYDRTAIHEVMEQQTVSIAKAGITTTLNARASILAAANPLYSRYNPKITPYENINMPAALLSRFDLVFILLDKARPEDDLQLAQHIGKLHKDRKSPFENLSKKIYNENFIKNYIGIAQQFTPTISPDVHKLISSIYVEKRQKQAESGSGDYYCTPRTLLSLIRLATAHAKLRQSNLVEEQDVEEAVRLFDIAQASVRTDDDEDEETGVKRRQEQPKERIFQEIKRVCNLKLDKTMTMDNLRKKVMNMGLREQDLKECLRTYGDDLNLLHVTNTSVSLI